MIIVFLDRFHPAAALLRRTSDKCKSHYLHMPSTSGMFRRILRRTLRSCAGSFGPCAAQGPAL
eukprot:scaffold23933_cov119-Isochrysis_galbana.AAC.2